MIEIWAIAPGNLPADLGPFTRARHWLADQGLPSTFFLGPPPPPAHVDPLTIDGSRATIRVHGHLQHARRFGDAHATLPEIQAAVDAAAEHPDVDHVLFDVRSPGGEASGLPDVYQAVRRLDERKPTVAYIRGIGGSGAYYIASATGGVYCEPMALVGCLGVLIVVRDRSGLLKEIGVDELRLTSDGAELKAAGLDDPEYVASLKAQANTTNSVFKADVAAARGWSEEVAARLFNGASHVGARAAELGLVDGVATWHDFARDVLPQLTPRRTSMDPEDTPAAPDTATPSTDDPTPAASTPDVEIGEAIDRFAAAAQLSTSAAARLAATAREELLGEARRQLQDVAPAILRAGAADALAFVLAAEADRNLAAAELPETVRALAAPGVTVASFAMTAPEGEAEAPRASAVLAAALRDSATLLERFSALDVDDEDDSAPKAQRVTGVEAEVLRELGIDEKTTAELDRELEALMGDRR